MTQQPTSVRATMNYTVDNGTPPNCDFYEPLERNPPGTDPHEVEIHNGWPRVDSFALDREGFALRPFTPSFDQFDVDFAIKGTLYREVVEFVKQHSGAQRAEVFDHTVRKRRPPELNEQTTVQRPAVLLVHSDYTVASSPQRVHDIVLDGHARFMGHSASEDPLTPPDALGRESIEVRTMAFF